MTASTLPLSLATTRPASMALRLRKGLGLLLALVALAVVGLSAHHLVDMREDALARASERAGDTARLLEAHLSNVVGTADFILDRVTAELVPQAPDAAAWGRLVALAAGLPERGNLAIVGADGRLLLTTVAFPTPEVDVTDRLFWQAHRDGARNFIGPMIVARTDGRSKFTFSRRVDHPDGSFCCAVGAGIDAEQFAGFFNALALGPHGHTTVIDFSGKLIIRLPLPQGSDTVSLAGTPLVVKARETPIGVLRGHSPIDGMERIVAYRTIPSAQLIVAAGIAVDDALASWHETVEMVAVWLSGFMLVLGGLTVIAFRGLAREHALMLGLEEAVRERTEEARRQADEALRANHSKTRFLAAASHDLRQPLQAAGMFAEVLAARLEDSDHTPVIDKLRQSIDATGTLLNTLLDVSTLESGKVEARKVTFSPRRLLEALGEQTAPDAAGRGLRLGVVPTSAWVLSDPVLLERMLRNLLVNALRYTRKGGVVLGCRRRGGELAIQVADTGIGIPEDKLQIIFEDFTRLEGARQFGPGPGLGLGVVRRMALLLGHRLEVRSVVGRGSVFSVLVPLAAGPGGEGRN